MNIKRKRLIILSANVLLILFSGLLFAWTVFVTPLEQEFGWQRAQTSLTFTLSLSLSTLAASVANFIAQKIKPQIIVFVSGIIVGVSLFLTSYITQLWQLYFLYGFVASVAMGMVYILCLSKVLPWFPDKPSFITGILLMSFGLGGMVLGNLANFIMELFHWSIAFKILGGIGFAVLAILAPFNRAPTEEEANLLPAAKSNLNTIDVSPREMLKGNYFKRLFIWYIPIAAVGLCVSSHSSPMAQSLGASATTAALVAGLVSFFNGFSRIFYGLLLDKHGNKSIVKFVSLMSLASPATLAVAVYFNSFELMVLGFIFSGITFGGGPVLIMSLVKTKFGQKYYGQNIGLANNAIVVGAIIGPYIGGIVYEQFSYIATMLLILGYCVVSFLLYKKI